MLTPLELRLQARVDRREMVHARMESLVAERDGGEFSDTDKGQITAYRSELADIDKELTELNADLEAQRAADERSKQIRRSLLGASGDIDENGDGVVYRTMASYARDVLVTRQSPIASQIAALVDPGLVDAAQARLGLAMRAPANTLSSDLAGLQPAQHIDQIFQVINKARPIVQSARRADLVRGQLTFPKITQRPLVAVQATEKTEAGNQKMIATMTTATASTYLGGGDLSWQAINWSTPDALALWFDLAGENYAHKTEADAARVIEQSAANHLIADQLAGNSSDTFQDWLTAVTEGAALVYSASGRLSDTIYVSPDLFYLVAALTSASFAQTIAVGSLNLGTQSGSFAGMKVVLSPQLDSGVAIVGDSSGLLVAETAGAPVELRVVEPAIGGVEVGIIGAFEAVVVDDGSFALISTNS